MLDLIKKLFSKEPQNRKKPIVRMRGNEVLMTTWFNYGDHRLNAQEYLFFRYALDEYKRSNGQDEYPGLLGGFRGLV